MEGSVMEKEIDNINVEMNLSDIEKDTIGEILNISMGAGATAISDLLNKKVVITTPKVDVVNSLNFEAKSLEPAICIEIEYVEGLFSSNFMVMKQRDVRTMVNIILSNDEDENMDEELDDMHLSAICEIMNQMMGASCTALANFFGKTINISTPKTYSMADFKSRIGSLSLGESLVTVGFSLGIENVIDSEFISILPMDFTKEMVNKALDFGNGDTPAEESSEQAQAPAPMREPESPPPVISAPPPEQKRYEEPPRAAQAVKPPPVKVQPVKLANFDEDQKLVNMDSAQASMDLLMGVPLEVTVEIGRAKKQVQEILDIRQGTIVELDKQAGDPVDIFVNGQLIAKGDVVVIDDNFGVRITEIITHKEIVNRLY